jgi:hypothetical protein
MAIFVLAWLAHATAAQAANTISAYTTNGTLLATWASPNPQALTATGGSVWAVDTDGSTSTVRKYSSSGVAAGSFTIADGVGSATNSSSGLHFPGYNVGYLHTYGTNNALVSTNLLSCGITCGTYFRVIGLATGATLHYTHDNTFNMMQTWSRTTYANNSNQGTAFDYAAQLTYDPTSTYIYAANRKTGTIWRYNEAQPASYSGQWNTASPTGVAGYGSNVYVAASGNVVRKFSSAGTLLSSWAVTDAYSIAVDGPNNIVYVGGMTTPPPTAPSALVQYRADGSTVVPSGGVTSDTTAVLRFSVSHPNPLLQVTPYVEVIPSAASFAATCGGSGTVAGPVVLTTTKAAAYTATVTVSGLTSGTSYRWRACAIDPFGAVSAWTAAGATPDFTVDTAPNAPANTSPANGAGGQLPQPTLAATYSDPDGGTGTVLFQLCADASCTSVVASGSSAVVSSGAGATWASTATLAAGTTYWWHAQGVDSYGVSGVWGATWSFQTGSGPTITDNQAGDATWRRTNSGSYDVDFADPAGLTKYETSVWSAAGQSGTQRQGWTQVGSLSGTSFSANWTLLASTFSAMGEGTNYVSVRVTSASGFSTTRADVFTVARDTVAPGAVTPLTAPSQTNASPALSWSAPSDATSGVAYYRVYRASSACSAFSQVSVDGTPTSGAYSDASATVGTWCYRVQAVDAAGNEQVAGNATTIVDYLGPTSLNVVLDNATVPVGSVIAGSDAVATSSVSVTSSNVSGYTLTATDASDTTALQHTTFPDTIADWTGTPASPTAWAPGVSGYFGITVVSATGGKDTARWGTGTLASDLSLNRYAGLRASTATLLFARAAYAAGTDTIVTSYRTNPSATQRPGAYAESVSYTVTANP